MVSETWSGSQHVCSVEAVCTAVVVPDGCAGRRRDGDAGREHTRLVPLVPELVPIVEEAMTGEPFAPLFTSRRGARLDSRNWRREAGWTRACALVGREGLRPHDLRHTAATAWLRATGDVKAVQALLGHSTATMTLDLYSHLLTDSLDRATDLMAHALVSPQGLDESTGSRGARA